MLNLAARAPNFSGGTRRGIGSVLHPPARPTRPFPNQPMRVMRVTQTARCAPRHIHPSALSMHQARRQAATPRRSTQQRVITAATTQWPPEHPGAPMHEAPAPFNEYASPAAEATAATRASSARTTSPWYRKLYTWVLIGIVAGVAVGAAWPKTAESLQPLGTVFISMITMVVTPIIFVTIVGGIAGVDDLRKVGRIGVKSLIYFEGMTTIALLLGLVVMNVFHPGSAIHANPASLKLTGTAAQYAAQGKAQGFWSILTEIVPSSAFGAFSTGNDLQVVFFSVLFGVAIKIVGAPATGIAHGVNRLGLVFFAILRVIMYAAPVGAFGAMAFTVGKYGLHTLTSLGSLIGLMYGTSAVFVLVALGTVCALFRLNILALLRYIKDELLIVLGTSSSETVLPQLMRKIERAGVPEDVVGLTVPTGYSFNLDGTCIYLTLAALFVAQATGVHLSLAQ